MRLELAFLKSKENTSLHLLYYAEAVPLFEKDVVTTDWQPQKDAAASLGKRWSLWFWRRIFHPSEFEVFCKEVVATKAFKTKTMSLEANIQERTPVFVSAGSSRTPLSPYADQSAWIWELWDTQKLILGQLSKKEVLGANTAVKAYLGLDLNYWRDRIGNIVAYFPTGIRIKWRYDKLTGTAVIQTNLQERDLADYKAELQLWDEEETSYHRLLSLERPVILFKGIDQFRKMQFTLYQHGDVVHNEGPLPIIQRIDIAGRFSAFSREGVHYHYGLEGIQTVVGETHEPPWVRYPRQRRALHEKEALEKALAFKFYEPDGQYAEGDVRRHAIADIISILNRAEKSIRIWDPYFASDATNKERQGTLANLELLRHVQNLSVTIEILLSCKDWIANESSASGTSPTLKVLGEELVKCRESFLDRYQNIFCKAWVRKGDTTFHDRFLIIDGSQVWMLGSSLNGLGLKHSTLVQIKYADQITTAFDAIWESKSVEQDPEKLRWGRVLGVPSAS